MKKAGLNDLFELDYFVAGVPAGTWLKIKLSELEKVIERERADKELNVAARDK
jgi:hypothetical protein